MSRNSMKIQKLDRENTSFANLDNNEQRNTEMNNMINPYDNEESKYQDYINPQSRIGNNEL